MKPPRTTPGQNYTFAIANTNVVILANLAVVYLLSPNIYLSLPSQNFVYILFKNVSLMPHIIERLLSKIAVITLLLLIWCFAIQCLLQKQSEKVVTL